VNTVPSADLFCRRFASDFAPDVRDRGAPYAADGSVTIVNATDRSLTAAVHGSYLYSVDVGPAGSRVRATCTCPYYRDVSFCKHIWAVFLVADKKGLLAALRAAPAQLAGDEEDESDGVPPHVDEMDEPDAPPEPQPPPPPARKPTWRQVLSRVRDGRTDVPHPTYRDRQILYVADAEEIARIGRVDLKLHSRRRLRDGTWGAEAPATMHFADVERLPDEADRRILQILAGASDDAFYYGSVTGFALKGGILEALLPLLCATGRFLLRDGGALTPLAWDGGEPWHLRLALRSDGGRGPLVLSARLHRAAESMELSDATLLPDGFLFARGMTARFRFGGDVAWIDELRRAGPVVVPRREVDRFIEEVYDLPGTFAIDLPEGAAAQEVRGTPRPLLQVTVDPHVNGRLNACFSFDYDGTIVAASDVRDRIYRRKEKRLILRDREAERAAEELLAPLGFKRVSIADEDIDYQIAVSKLPRAVADLLARGWQIEAEGALYRAPGGFRLSVSSGIDWFDLEGGVEYGDHVVPFPRLLEALRRGQNWVKLGNGAVGLLPEEWLKRRGLVLSTAEAHGDALRFRPGQALLLDALLAAENAATCDETFRRLRDELASFDGVEPRDPPPGFQGTLRPYQRLGVGWTEFLRKFRLGGCLADDMGLGKTVTVLALLEARRQAKAGASLVVMPRSLVFNWKAEAERFAPSLRVLDFTGAGRSLGDADVVLTTYGTLRRDAPRLKDVRFDYVILDEAQAIKNAMSATAKAARLLKGEHRLALSGTPIENHLGELWSLMEFLNPGLLGSASVFKDAVGTGRELDEATRSLLARALRPFILRRTKAQVAPELPPKVEQTLTVELQPWERKRYDELREHYRQSLLNGTRDWKRGKFIVLEALLRLRQAACHVGLLDRSLRGESGAKLDALLEQVREVIDEGHKALIFSQFTSLLDIVRRRLDREKVAYEYLDGRTRDRAARVERFQTDPACPLFLISVKAGGLGLNLTAAEYVFLLDPWWNPAVEAQAIDRTHRIGQARHVFAYRLVARDTVEEKVLELQKSKRALADAILLEDRSLLRDLTREDLALLLS